MLAIAPAPECDWVDMGITKVRWKALWACAERSSLTFAHTVVLSITMEYLPKTLEQRT